MTDPLIDFAENRYRCIFHDDACQRELIFFTKLLLVVTNLCNLLYFANKLVCTVLTDLLTEFAKN